MLSLKWPLTFRLLPFRAAMLDFRWTICFHLMQHSVGGTYSGKVIKHTIASLSVPKLRAWKRPGGSFTPPPVIHRRVNTMFFEIMFVYIGLLVVDMNNGDDSALMTYIKRRRAINRRAAAKSRAKLRERTKHVKQVLLSQYYCSWISYSYVCTMWVKNPPSRNFLTFFPNGWEFLVQILHAY